MSEFTNYVLTHPYCEECTWSENGYYNAVCAHCPYCAYGKAPESSFMTREMAEALGLTKREENENGQTN